MLSAKPLALARTTVTAAAVAHLREEIIHGGLEAGDALPESRVGELLSVSRAPVREALTILEREGLIAYDRRGTARVCRFGLEEVRELGLMRLALEPLAARLTAERRPESIISTVQSNISELKAAKRLDDFTRLDLEFHRFIVAASGNTRLAGSWENLSSQFLLVMRRFHRAWNQRTRAVRDTTVRAHTELFRAIQSGLPGEAESIARRHATGWLSELEQSKAFAANSEEAE